jgi:hypothetical protein
MKTKLHLVLAIVALSLVWGTLPKAAAADSRFGFPYPGGIARKSGAAFFVIK